MFGNKNHPTDTNREEKLQSKIEDLEGQIKDMRIKEEDTRRSHERQIEDIERENEHEREDNERAYAKSRSNMEQAHKLALEQMEFNMKNFKDEELNKAREALAAAEKKAAISEKENAMLRELVKVSSDIIDIKTLVRDIIGKLPNINISSSSLGGGATQKGEKKE